MYLKVISIVISIVFGGWYLFRGTVWVIRNHSEGQGYTSKVWQCSETVKRVRALPAGILIFTNRPDAIYFLTGKLAYTIPARVNSTTLTLNDNYLSRLALMKEQLKKPGAVLVYFNYMLSTLA
jgi:hypothetical protein